MKKCLLLACLLVFLTGCGAAQTFETITDTPYLPALAQMREMQLQMPQEAAVSVVNSDSGEKLYLCEGYVLTVQTLEGGNLEKTVQTLSGFSSDQLSLIETQGDHGKRYDWVWTAMGEGGQQIGRAAVLDDGSYHYCVSVMAQADTVSELQTQWNTLFGSFALG